MKTVVYEPLCGQHIDTAIDECRAKAKRLPGSRVVFKFNGVKLAATPKTSADSLRWSFTKGMGDRAQRWHRTRAYRVQQIHRAAEVAFKQREIDALVAALPKTIQKGEADTMCWLRRLAELADDVAVSFDKGAVVGHLEVGGYRENEHVGQPSAWFSTRDRLARFIVGQAINCLRSGMPPHPITAKFCDDYDRLEVQDEPR